MDLEIFNSSISSLVKPIVFTLHLLPLYQMEEISMASLKESIKEYQKQFNYPFLCKLHLTKFFKFCIM